MISERFDFSRECNEIQILAIVLKDFVTKILLITIDYNDNDIDVVFRIFIPKKNTVEFRIWEGNFNFSSFRGKTVGTSKSYVGHDLPVFDYQGISIEL